MLDQNSENNSFSAIRLVLFLWNKKKILISISLVAAIASVIFSSPFFIPPKYKSTLVLFPSSTNSPSKALLSDNQSYKQDLLRFGEEEDAEQLLQILNSSKIRDRIIQKYNLMQHYDIDENGEFKRTLLNKEYESNIRYRRTENMAVEITVMDINPDTAAFMANNISALLDSVKIKMQKERAYRGYQIVKAEYDKLGMEIKIKEDSMTRLREFGIHDYETQAEMINRQLAIEIAKSANSSSVKALNDKLDVLAKYGGAYVSLRDALEHDKKLFSEVREKYDKARIDYEEELPQTFIADPAYPAEKKSYPVRWVIVVVATLSSFLLTAFVLVIADGILQETKQ